MSNYYDWQDFANIYLEDSFVLDISESKNEISFFIEAVLTENHPFYTDPHHNEQYCYKNGKIVFKLLEPAIWVKKNKVRYIDSNDEVDYGNIDNFTLIDNQYTISGDWGELKVISYPVEIVWT